MSAEIHVSSRTLALRINGVYSPTERGHLAHELVLINRILKKNADPNVAFVISQDMERKYIARREELCSLLGLPSDERTREKKIQGFDGFLTRMGLPYYKVRLPSNEK